MRVIRERMRAGDYKAVAAVAMYGVLIVAILVIAVGMARGGSNGDDLPNTGITMEELGMDKNINLCPMGFDSWLVYVCKIYAVDPDIVRAIIERESGWKPDAVNPETGAAGLMQIMPGTWDAQTAELARKFRISSAFFDPLDPYDNVRVGLWLLSKLIDKSVRALPFALDCYALGEGAAEDRLLAMADYKPTEWTRGILARAEEIAAARDAQLSNGFIPAEAEIK